MSYTPLTFKRIAYDIDGTVIARRTSGWTNGVEAWFTGAQAAELNDEDLTAVISYTANSYDNYTCLWFFFPEKREIKGITFAASTKYSSPVSVYGSNDTTNGIDGTWETATLPDGAPDIGNTSTYWWRTGIKRVSFTTGYKTIRVHTYMHSYYDGAAYIYGIHLYGNKFAGETVDDILFCDDAAGTELTAVKDWGDNKEGSTTNSSVYLKNTSATKTANTITVTANFTTGYTDYLISLDQATWGTSVNIASLAPGAVSAPIYIKNTIGAAPQILGPRIARLVAAIGSWT
jgi:hypothetical protein